ncbi:hypothetical protein SUDANB15_06785 [Streptomyces sp. enrichment culture]|uniref:BNR repeat-containing protein n=1 Tax=Streptomyces sp. enrichment culture TaxID=1795815 RepID=UPI003F55ADD4
MRRRTLLTGALLGTVTAPALAAGAAAPGPSVTRTGRTTLDHRAIHFVSYDGLVNNDSFQKNGLLTHRGHQYAAWCTADRGAVVGRRALGASTWQTARVGHTLRYDDPHNVISMGVSRSDGRLHLNMDSHSDGFTRVRSVAGLMDDPAGQSWTANRFGAPQSTLDGLALTPRFTYPRFIATPEGRLQLSHRAGVSGNGRNALAEYDGARWTALGEWTGSTGAYRGEHGSSTARNMYLHGIDYDRNGRLHAFFTWRDDAGTVVGTTGGPGRVSATDPGLVVDPLDPDHSLMNQESQFTDSAGRPHAVISYVPGRFGRCTADYVADRTRSGRAFHVRKTASGTWRKTGIPVPGNSGQRTKLVLDRYDNAYAILPHGRTAGASAASDHTDWKLLHDGAGLNAFGEVVIDETRVARDGVLSFPYQEKSSGTTPSALHVVDFRPPA